MDLTTAISNVSSNIFGLENGLFANIVDGLSTLIEGFVGLFN